MRVAISQPTYLPWMGYFGLMDAVDLFVFYDDTQFVKQSWQQRNRIKTSKGELWLTVPVVRQFGQEIKDVKIDNSTNWSKKHIRSIMYNYEKSPYYEEFYPIMEDLYNQKWQTLLELNLSIIKTLMDFTGINTETMLSSELNTTGTKTDRLVEMLDKIGATEYVSGPAARSYLDKEKLEENGFSLYWYEFEHPVYPQLYGEFIPYLSAIDLIFNTGEGAAEIIRRGGKNAIKRAE